MYNEFRMDSNMHSESTQETVLLFEPNTQEEIMEVFLFELDKELYAVPVEDVEQVMKIPPVTTVPNAPDSILGIFHLRGKVIVAIDILKRMRIVRTSSFVPIYLFISRKQKNYFAIVVDRVFSVIKVPTREILPLTSVISSKINAEYVRGMFNYTEPAKVTRKLDSFLIEPKKSQQNPVSEPLPMRPVLLLNIPFLLDQNDILQIGSTEVV